MANKPIKAEDVAPQIWATIEKQPPEVQVAALEWLGGAFCGFPPVVQERKRERDD